MPLQYFSSLRNATNGVLEGQIGKNFFWWVGDYCNGVQPPLSEIPGSAPDYIMINSIFDAVIQVILQAAFYILVLKAH